jgi:hypothetical protein
MSKMRSKQHEGRNVPCNHKYIYVGLSKTEQWLTPRPVLDGAGRVIGTACEACDTPLTSTKPVPPKVKRPPPENLLLPGINRKGAQR